MPVLDAILDDPEARALYLFPTKALGAGSARGAARAGRRRGDRPARRFTYDGDTPPNARRAVRAAGHVVLTNPDMLHSGILPHHPKWVKLFENLQFVVIDELHAYRGVFGSHVANVMRRLRRICRHYGSDPVFICSSATIANPRELAERLIDGPVELVDENGAPRGEKFFLVVNPPVVNEQLGIRGSSLAHRAAPRGAAHRRRRADDRLRAESRTAVEVLTTLPERDVRSAAPGRPDAIRGYRGGYLPNERREIERRAARRAGARRRVHQRARARHRHRRARCGDRVGYPGTHRGDLAADGPRRPAPGTSLGGARRSSAPIDQFVVAHPDYLFDARRSTASSTPTTCTSSSTTSSARPSSCRSPPPSASGSTRPRRCSTCSPRTAASATRTDDRYYWSHENFPASDFSLRSGAPDNVVIVDTTGDRHRVIGEVDLFAAPLLVHEKAIYIHEGVQYHVDRLDWEERKAYVTRTDVDYYTDADLGITLKVLEVLRRGGCAARRHAAARRGHGRLEGDHVQEDQVPHPRERRLGLDQHPRAGDAHHRLLAGPARRSSSTGTTATRWTAHSSASRAWRARPLRCC